MSVADWAAVDDGLERLTSLKSLNGCDQYVTIRAGGMQEIYLHNLELGVWAARFLERSTNTLTSLDVR